MRLAGWALVLLWASGAGSACSLFGKLRPVDRTLARVTGPTGWFRVTALLGVDAEGNATIPPRDRVRGEDEPVEPDDEEFDEDTPLEERLARRFKRQLSPMLLDPGSSCAYFSASPQAGRPVFVIVHGVRGLGSEFWPAIPTLAAARPAGIFLFRWNITQQRGAIIEALVTGTNRIAACHPDGATIMLAHSAGGVVASLAASRFHSPRAPLEISTIAATLAGAGLHQSTEDSGETRFWKDLGSTRHSYPAAAPNVRVTHYRTHYPADRAMRPTFGHPPNERGVGVLGATEIDLPFSQTHDGSVLFVARRVVAELMR